MKKSLLVCLVVGLASAGVTNAGVVTWAINIQHSGSALGLSTTYDPDYEARTGYLNNSAWSWVRSEWDATLPDSFSDPGGTAAQVYGAFRNHPTGYADVRARAGMEATWWAPAIPTDADLAYTFDFPFVSSVSVGSNSIDVTLADDWGDTYAGTGYLQIMGQHPMTAEEEASGLWYTKIWDGTAWVKHATARYALTYDAPTNTFNNTTFSWSDFDWENPGTYNIDFLAVETGLTIGGVSGLIEEITVTGGSVSIPEPASIIVWSLLGGLGITVGWWRRRRKTA